MKAVVELVTLDDFASKMPSWAPDLPNHLYALVDMGSNGIRFSISDLSPPCSRLLKCLYRERAPISLFDALEESPSSGSSAFASEVITRVSQTLARFKSIADQFGVPPEHVSVFATEAMRKASNSAVMLDAIRSASGLGVHILAPEVETLFGAMGARSAFTTVDGLFLDLGGGSVQMTYMNSATADYAIQAARSGRSLPFGAARLISVLDNSSTESRTATLDQLQAGMHDAFLRLLQEFKLDLDGRGIDIYLCGGGFRGYGSILMHNDPINPYPIPAVGAYTVNGSFFTQTATMRKVNAEYDSKIFGMSKRRRKHFPAIATVVEALIGAVPRIRTVTFCSGGNREGVLLLKLPSTVREASPLPLLHHGSITMPEALKAITRMVQSALPSNLEHSHVPTVLSLGLGPLFASEIWSGIGEPSEANASFQLHKSLARDPSVPGFTHLARSVLALTLCFRWGATLGPIDRQLLENLQKLVSQVHPEAVFWAKYIGEIAHLLSRLHPRAPETQVQLENTVGYSAIVAHGKNKTKLQLTVFLSAALYQNLDHQQIINPFKWIGKQQEGTQMPCDKVEVLVQMIQSS